MKISVSTKAGEVSNVVAGEVAGEGQELNYAIHCEYTEAIEVDLFGVESVEAAVKRVKAAVQNGDFTTKGRRRVATISKIVSYVPGSHVPTSVQVTEELAKLTK